MAVLKWLGTRITNTIKTNTKGVLKYDTYYDIGVYK